MTDDDMGNPDNITNKTIEKAAKASGQSKKQTLKNIIESAQKELQKVIKQAGKS
ncbi:hypothetical protein HY386_01740 [Candidatus Daviesbacteria bacterium]|nr:hypothetical protein [Candidatus Daviesbacteria bacterium]